MRLLEIKSLQMPDRPWENGKKCETLADVAQWCSTYIKNSTFNIDSKGLVSCRNKVELDGIGKNERHVWVNLPVQFNHVTSHFRIRNRGLTTLLGCPEIVDGVFDCSGNHLASLKHAPEAVDSFIFCDNRISSLDSGKKITVSANFISTENPIIDIRGIANHLRFDGRGAGTIALDWEKIRHGGLGLLEVENLEDLDTVLTYSSGNGVSIARGDNFLDGPWKIINRHLKEKDIFACQQELIENGFEDYAEL